MRREEYLYTLTEQIRCKMARGTIEQEINDHIEDQKAEFLSEGMSQTEGEDAGSETKKFIIQRKQHQRKQHPPFLPLVLV